MTSIFKAACIATTLTGFANGAAALSPSDANGVSLQAPAPNAVAVARLDQGRLISVPHAEVYDWTLLAQRQTTKLDLLTAAQSLPYLSVHRADEPQPDNIIDHIRLTAANEGYAHVLIYGMGADARWSSFAGKALTQTGLIIHDDCDSWSGARTKALLVNSFTGEVVGAATSDQIEFHIGDLADGVQSLLQRLEDPVAS